MVNYSSYKTSVYLDNHLVNRNESKTSTFTTWKSTKFNILFEAALNPMSKDIDVHATNGALLTGGTKMKDGRFRESSR